MSNLPMLIGGALILGGLLWLVWPQAKRTAGTNWHVQLEALLAATKNAKARQHLREAGRAMYEEPDAE